MTMLDFYRQHDISPVAQDITDLSAHFARRAALYRSLGLPPIAIRGKSVLEVGPGAGENALYTASLKPARYVFMEPNPSAADALRQRWPPRRGGEEPWEIYQQSVEVVWEDDDFDVVLCEGLLGLCGSDPKVMLEHVIKHVAPGGVLVITCIDPISDHAEVLRRAHARGLISMDAPLAEQLEILRPVFAPHLATLKGMTRSVDDWIVDNLINPASIGPTFSIPDACAALDGRFELLGCSPRFLVDWRWYKESEPGLQWVIDAYWKEAHNLIDCRCVVPDYGGGRYLYESCLAFREELRRFEIGERPDLPQNDGGEDILEIPDWFGRGQQYLSFVKRDV